MWRQSDVAVAVLQALGQAAVVLIRPLAWEPPYVMGATLKRKKKIYLVILKNQQVSYTNCLLLFILGQFSTYNFESYFCPGFVGNK